MNEPVDVAELGFCRPEIVIVRFWGPMLADVEFMEDNVMLF